MIDKRQNDVCLCFFGGFEVVWQYWFWLLQLVDYISFLYVNYWQIVYFKEDDIERVYVNFGIVYVVG